MIGRIPVFKTPSEAFDYVGITDSSPLSKVVSGAIKRVRAGNKRDQKTDGWILGFRDGKGFICGNWNKGNIEAIYAENGKRCLTKEERLIIEAERLRNEAEKRRIYENASRKATLVWENSIPVESHIYLSSKWVYAVKNLRQINIFYLSQLLGYMPSCLKSYLNRERIDGEDQPFTPMVLVVPIELNGKIYSLQFITGDGDKDFLYQGRQNGCYWMANKFESHQKPEFAYICEGVATALSIQQNSHCNALCFSAMSAYRLMETMKSLFKKYGKSLYYVFWADNDHWWDTREDNFERVGQHCAEDANYYLNKVLGGCGEVRIPDFIKRFGGHAIGLFQDVVGALKIPKDWNDYYIMRECYPIQITK